MHAPATLVKYRPRHAARSASHMHARARGHGRNMHAVSMLGAHLHVPRRSTNPRRCRAPRGLSTPVRHARSRSNASLDAARAAAHQVAEFGFHAPSRPRMRDNPISEEILQPRLHALREPVHRRRLQRASASPPAPRRRRARTDAPRTARAPPPSRSAAPRPSRSARRCSPTGRRRARRSRTRRSPARPTPASPPRRR